MTDQLQEIWGTLKKNKLRTTLTGLSVSWGIFILIVLLGAGNGLQNGVMENFSSRAINRVNLWPGTTSMPFQGLRSERRLNFTESELDFIQSEVEESRLITARTSKAKPYRTAPSMATTKWWVSPNFYEIEKLIIAPAMAASSTS